MNPTAVARCVRITGITDLVDSSRSWTHGYDALDRLTTSSKTGQTIGYSYDANGNRLTQSGTQSATYTVSGTSNRLSSITGTPARTYAYDAAGNTTGYAGLTFTYSDAGRMSSVTSASGTTSYVLNALGQRLKKSDPAGTRLFVYDEAGHLLGEYDAAGALIQETIWMGDIPVATLQPNGTGGVNVFYVHTDHLNTPRRISRPSDNVIVWRWDSDPFGTSAANEDPDGDSNLFAYQLRFPGQYFDAESGLHYNYFREYDSYTGRYGQADPADIREHVLNFFADRQVSMRGIGAQDRIAVPLELNPYAYVAGNPNHWRDPTGEAIAIPAICLLTPANAAACAAAIAAAATAIATAINQCISLFDGDALEDRNTDDECYEKCKHLLPSPSGDLQASEYRKCYRECKGSL